MCQAGKAGVIFERNSRALGASIRNFGLVWPVGQQAGEHYARAMASRRIWKELADATGLECNETGSLHLAYEKDELAVLEEFVQKTPGNGYSCELLTPHQVSARSNAVKTAGLLGAMYSPTEMTVNPREACARIAAWLEEQLQVTMCFNTPVNGISMPFVETSEGFWKAGKVFLCSGADFETLYPQAFATASLTKCKLQMMRTVPQPGKWQLGPALCAGLTLLHYAAFNTCSSLAALRQRIAHEMPQHLQWGVHVLVSQNGAGELTIGDSHEYGSDFVPFDREFVNELILQYMHRFLQAPDFTIQERWHGIYPKLTNGHAHLLLHPEKDVTIINGLGGAGMTLSFGLAEEIAANH
ncbi:TIGR03364 family FAD-dependent oxidoreductase [uncultured Chitinophaga sp.]|uniref:TIGR03364 family FAD-dependent oxidoreductase n=1 Tax=uncultured Chitinophaga sp. TaxID=339340 RepID=UPI003451A8F1